jgi:hypothetical protein
MFRLRHFVAPLAGLALSLGVVGCATTNEHVPSNAQMVSSGNETVAFTAPRHGMVYVVDKNTNKLLYSGNVDRGQVVTIDPTKRDRNITLDNNTVTQESLNVGHTYQIYFEPSDHADRVTVDEHIRRDEHVHHDSADRL